MSPQDDVPIAPSAVAEIPGGMTEAQVPFRMILFINTLIYFSFSGFAAYTAWSDPSLPVKPKASSTTTLALFWHNLGVLGWLATGICSLGLLTGAVIGLNGILLGWVVGKQIAAGNLHSLVTGMLPHFPLEIGAYLISAAASMRLGWSVIAWLRNDRDPARLRWRDWARMQGIAVAALLIAAFVEANISHV